MSPDPDIPSPSPTPAGDGAGSPSGGGRLWPKREDRSDKEPVDPSKDPGGDPVKRPRRYGFDKRKVREVIERYYKIYEERDALPGLDQSVLVAFFVLGDQEEVEADFQAMQRELREIDPKILPVLREEGGERAIVVTRRQEVRGAQGRLPLFLFLFTLLTLVASGSIAFVSYEGSADIARMLEYEYLWKGTWGFALPLLAVFGVQHVVRRAVAKRHDVKLGGSYLIPVPPFVFFPSIGTFGSVSHPREPLPDRKALFDIAAAGPLSAFLMAIPVVVIGLLLTTASAVPVPDGGAVVLVVEAPDGTTWNETGAGLVDPFERAEVDDPNRAHNETVTFSRTVAGRDHPLEGWRAVARGLGSTGKALDTRLNVTGYDADDDVVLHVENRSTVAPGERAALSFDLSEDTERIVVVLEYHVPDRTTVPLGEPLAFQGIAFVVGVGDLVYHPVALAGWTAMLVVGLSLVPAGRLDGGAVARCVLGDRMIAPAWISLGVLAALAFVYPGWVYFVLIVLLFIGVRHPAPLNETMPLDNKRWAVFLLLVAVLVLSFVLIPAHVPTGGF